MTEFPPAPQEFTDDEIAADHMRQVLEAKDAALDLIASSTAKAGSAIKLANIAREALGRPVVKQGKGGGDE